MKKRDAAFVWMVCVATPALALSACGASGVADDEPTSAEEEPFVYLTSGRWPKKHVNVCFTEGIPATERSWVRDTLKGQRSWEMAGNVNLVGWGTCASGFKGIEISSSDLGSETYSLGPDANGKVRLRLDVTAAAETHAQLCVDRGLAREQCIKTVALHEFGHALGVAHEHKHPQKPASCTETAGTPGNATYGAWDADSIMGYCGNKAIDLSGRDRRGFARMYGQRDGDPPRLADANKDGRDDILCHDASSGRKWVDHASSSGTFAGTNWAASVNYCAHDTGRLFKGDFNGDDRSDLLCHDIATGAKWISYANSSGEYPTTGWSTSSAWCNQDRQELFVGDFSMDGHDDLLCHDLNTGNMWIDYADSSGRFLGTDWSTQGTWCNGPTQRVFVGNFDGKFGDDMLCADIVTGQWFINYVTYVGWFEGATWSRQANWCNHPDEQIYIGDFNGDRRDDVLCHDSVSGGRWIDYADSNGAFGGTDLQLGSWCKLPTRRVYVGNVDGLGGDDIVCHDVRSGITWVDYAGTGDFSGADSVTSTAWCNHDSAQFL